MCHSGCVLAQEVVLGLRCKGARGVDVVAGISILCRRDVDVPFEPHSHSCQGRRRGHPTGLFVTVGTMLFPS